LVMGTLAAATAAAVAVASCGPKQIPGQALTGGADAAAKVYVAPGQYDEFYAFLSGGFNGNLAVYGLPSGRLLRDIPVFSQYPEKGYGYNEQTKAMLNTSYGTLPWDDSHHPSCPRPTACPTALDLHQRQQYPRIARIDLTTMGPGRSSKSPTPPATILALRHPGHRGTPWPAPASACRPRRKMSRSRTTKASSKGC
jgi:hypothetical protein